MSTRDIYLHIADTMLDSVRIEGNRPVADANALKSAIPPFDSDVSLRESDRTPEKDARSTLRFLFSRAFGRSGRYRSNDFNQRYGRWRVLYSDGSTSLALCADVALDYARMFDGRVIRA